MKNHQYCPQIDAAWVDDKDDTHPLKLKADLLAVELFKIALPDLKTIAGMEPFPDASENWETCLLPPGDGAG